MCLLIEHAPANSKSRVFSMVLNDILKYHWECHCKSCFTTEWYIVEQYVQIPLRVTLKSDLLLKTMSNTIGSTIKVWFYHWKVQWNWMVFSYSINSITENNILPLNGSIDWIVLQITIESTIEFYWSTIEWYNGTEWYCVVLQITIENTIDS